MTTLTAISDPQQRHRSRAWTALAVIFILIVAALLCWAHLNPLPSDEQMIAHFNAHRPEIEALVKSFRESKQPRTVAEDWHAQPETKALMHKAGVKHVGGSAPIWFPNPYSVEGRKQFDTPGALPGFDRLPYKTTALTLEDHRPGNSLRWVLLRSGPQLIFKELNYFPEVARIEEGKLLWPVGMDGQIYQADRLLPSLNEYPPDWKEGECVFRKIEQHWFIRMCIAVI